MITTIGVIVALLICAPVIWWYFILWKYKSLNKMVGPKPRPIFGNALEFGKSPQDFFRTLTNYSKDYGSIFKIYIGNELRVIISNPETAEQVLSSNVLITKSNAYDLFKKWLGEGLLISTGAKWKVRRKVITPTFHFKILDQFLEVFNSCGNILVDKLRKEVGKESVDVYPFVNLCSLDIICETAMGIKVSTQEGHNTQYVEAVKGFLDIFIVRTFSTWKRYDILFKMSPMYTSYKKFLNVLHQFTNNIIIKRRKEKSGRLSMPTDDGIKQKMALLDMLLEYEDNNMLSVEDIREEIDTFMFEGHDTTTSGIAFAFLALANNPDVQDKLYEEVISIIGNKDTPTNVTMQQLQDAKYLDLVMKEVQRIYPSVPLIERLLEKDTNIGGHNCPKDAFLTLFIYRIHRDERYFPEPEKFDPNRFLPENQSKRPNYAYVPFSAGPRNCIGQKFAMLEMKATIMKVIKNFKILPVPNYKPDLGIAAILKSYNGVCVRLQQRQPKL